MEDESTLDAAAALRRDIEAPLYNRTLRRNVGVGDLDYEVYLRTRALLALQTPFDRLVVPDELLFQVVHQTQELWLKCAAFEATHLVNALDAGRAAAAGATLDRIVAISRTVARDIEVMFTLSPGAFHVIRRSLGNGSGLESPGYNAVMHVAAAVEAAFARWLVRRDVSLEEVYGARETHAETHRLAEQLCDWDSAFQGWLMAHFVLVRRTLGVSKSVRALDGFPTQALPARMTRPLFPALWDVRVTLSEQWSRDGGFAPGQPRTTTPGRSGEHVVAAAFEERAVDQERASR